MRSYRHYCGLARALDVVGDRWTLLIVRELLVRGPSRYTDLQHGLPGIATNLLVTRLREMEESGLVVREESPAPAAATLFRLTPRGEELEIVIAAFGRWAGPLMGECRDDDETRSHWLALPVRLYLTDNAPSRRPIAIELRTAGEPMLIETLDGDVRARPGSAENPDAVLDGPPDLIMGVLMSRLSLATARRRGLHFRGDAAALDRVRRR
jgi:DNA-binding HxlR family transcriptional regulator